MESQRLICINTNMYTMGGYKGKSTGCTHDAGSISNCQNVFRKSGSWPGPYGVLQRQLDCSRNSAGCSPVGLVMRFLRICLTRTSLLYWNAFQSAVNMSSAPDPCWLPTTRARDSMAHGGTFLAIRKRDKSER